MIVVKFGGTSVANAIAMTQAAKIILSQKNQKQIVILSACATITNKLIDCSEISAKHGFKKIEPIFNVIANHHYNLINELEFANHKLQTELILLIDKYLNELKELLLGIGLLEELNDLIYAKILSYGELLSSTIFNVYLSQFINTKFINSNEFIKTNNNYKEATVDFEQTNSNLSNKLFPLFGKYQIIVCQGFIGSDIENNITLLGRGGSDYSAAIYGAGLNVDDIQIWTDVSGVMSADPRKISSARTIDFMSANELAELSFFGAKVVHPLTIQPAIAKNIKVTVRNTFLPDSNFTTIMNEIQEKSSFHSLIHLKKCDFISFHNENIKDFIIKTSNLNLKIITLIHQNNICRILANEIINKEILMDFDYIGENVDCIVISGHNLLQLNVVEFKNVINKFEKNFQIITHNNNSLVIKVKPNFSEDIVKNIHNLIIKKL